MAISEAYTGSETVGTTEWSLPRDASYSAASPTTVDGIYQIWVDVSAMAAADQFVFKLYEKVTSGGSQLTVGTWTLTGAQPSPLVLPSMILLHGWDFTADKITGTDRALTWSIRSVA